MDGLRYAAANRIPAGLPGRHFDSACLSFCADASLFGGGSPHALTKRHIDMMGASGLRTLVMAAREVDEREYAAWEQEYRQAQVGGVKARRDLLARRRVHCTNRCHAA